MKVVVHRLAPPNCVKVFEVMVKVCGSTKTEPLNMTIIALD